MIRLVNIFWSCCFVRGVILKKSSGKRLEKVDNSPTVIELRKHLTSNQQTSEFLYEFEESENTRKQELTNNEN